MSALGDYLRARRALIEPADVGLSATGIRRTPGLRREEVALLAGISADYYLRLEQGRDRNPSGQVLDALARVFGLDDAARHYVHGLVHAPVRVVGDGDAARPGAAPVSEGVAQLVATINLPAFVEGRYFDVLATNPLARALCPTFDVGQNRVRSVFLDPAERDFYVDWEGCLPGITAALRASIGSEVDDPQIVRLVGELSLKSGHFRELWARHDVIALAGADVDVTHPVVGRMQLRREKLPIGDSEGQLLAVFSAAPGSTSAARLEQLRHTGLSQVPSAQSG